MTNRTGIANQAPSSTREALVARLKESVSRRLRQGVTASAIAISATQGVVGCASDIIDTRAPSQETGVGELGFDGKDWAQQQGTRRTDMVTALGQTWHQYVDCYGGRGGCQALNVFVKVRIKPVEGVNPLQKRVGIQYRTANGANRTANGYWFTTYEGGDYAGWEEWHVPVYMRAYEAGVFTYNAWYQPQGANTAPFYDDNGGELHPATWNSPVLYPDASSLRITNRGVEGTLDIQLVDLDPDKVVTMVWTTSHWAERTPDLRDHDFQIATREEMEAGHLEQLKNKWYYVGDTWNGYERWRINVEVPVTPEQPVYEEFEYAILYKHGVGRGQDVLDGQVARNYDFWLNGYNGSNYVVRRVTANAPTTTAPAMSVEFSPQETVPATQTPAAGSDETPAP